MDYKDKIKEILKDNTIPEQLRKKMEEILLAAEEIEEDKRLKEFLCKTFTKQYLCSDKLGKWHGEPVANILTWIEKQGNKPQGKTALEAIHEQKVDNANKVEAICMYSTDNYTDEERKTLCEGCEISCKYNPTAWSEKDEGNLTDTCVAIRKFYHSTNGAQELVDWLKSLKQRVKGC